jgi:hypothetical protein
VAYDTGAVRETLHGGGILLREKAPAVVAELVHGVLHDPGLQARVLETQARALREIRDIDFRALLLDRLRPVLGPDDPGSEGPGPASPLAPSAVSRG